MANVVMLHHATPPMWACRDMDMGILSPSSTSRHPSSAASLELHHVAYTATAPMATTVRAVTLTSTLVVPYRVC